MEPNGWLLSPSTRFSLREGADLGVLLVEVDRLERGHRLVRGRRLEKGHRLERGHRMAKEDRLATDLLLAIIRLLSYAEVTRRTSLTLHRRNLQETASIKPAFAVILMSSIHWTAS